MTKVPENIHDLVEQWHNLPADDRRPLHEYLGLTWSEYKAWGEGLVTKHGTILTGEICEELADQAEAGGPGRTLTDTERAVWAAWNRLPDDAPSPVKRIATELGMAAADVAAIVYPEEAFGSWDDSQEPDLT